MAGDKAHQMAAYYDSLEKYANRLQEALHVTDTTSFPEHTREDVKEIINELRLLAGKIARAGLP